MNLEGMATVGILVSLFTFIATLGAIYGLKKTVEEIKKNHEMVVSHLEQFMTEKVYQLVDELIKKYPPKDGLRWWLKRVESDSCRNPEILVMIGGTCHISIMIDVTSTSFIVKTLNERKGNLSITGLPNLYGDQLTLLVEELLKSRSEEMIKW
jgi:hypothetical protein